MLVLHQTYNLLLTSRREIIATGLGMLAVMNKEKQHVLVKRLKGYITACHLIKYFHGY